MQCLFAESAINSRNIRAESGTWLRSDTWLRATHLKLKYLRISLGLDALFRMPFQFSDPFCLNPGFAMSPSVVD